MTSALSSSSRLKPFDHSEATRLLPWLPTDGLQDEERSRLLLHLDTCAPCRRELLYLSELRAALDVAGRPSIESHDTEASLETVMGRLDDARRPAIGVDGDPRFSGSSRSRPWWPLAAALAVALMGAFFFLRLDPPAVAPGPAATFITLSDGSTAPAEPADRARLALGFRDETPIDSIVALLHRIDADVVSGPSKMGIFVIEVEPDRAEPTLDLLRSQSEVHFAEPKP